MYFLQEFYDGIRHTGSLPDFSLIRPTLRDGLHSIPFNDTAVAESIRQTLLGNPVLPIQQIPENVNPSLFHVFSLMDPIHVEFFIRVITYCYPIEIFVSFFILRRFYQAMIGTGSFIRLHLLESYRILRITLERVYQYRTFVRVNQYVDSSRNFASETLNRYRTVLRDRSRWRNIISVAFPVGLLTSFFAIPECRRWFFRLIHGLVDTNQHSPTLITEQPQQTTLLRSLTRAFWEYVRSQINYKK